MSHFTWHLLKGALAKKKEITFDLSNRFELRSFELFY